MREALQRAFEDLPPTAREQRLSATNRQVLAVLTPGDPPGAGAATGGVVAKLLYRARKLGQHWCSYAHQVPASAAQLARLRNEWVVLAHQLAPLAPQQQVAVLWMLFLALEPGTARYDARLARYLLEQETAVPAHFHGLTTCPHLPSAPGPAAFFVHAVAELEAAAAAERAELHEVLNAAWDGQPVGLLQILAEWVQARH